MQVAYARFRRVRRPPVVVSPPTDDVVAFLVPEAAVFFEVAEGACDLAAVAFLTAELAVVAFRDGATLLFVTVVPDDVVDETLPLRSVCLVPGRERGERTDLGPAVAALLAGLFVWEDGGRAGAAPRDEPGRALPRLPVVDLRGLEGFSGDMGRDRYEDDWPFSGEARRGDCGYVLEFEDLGERIL